MCARVVHIYVCIYPMTFPPFLHVVTFIEQLGQLRLGGWRGESNYSFEILSKILDFSHAFQLLSKELIDSVCLSTRRPPHSPATPPMLGHCRDFSPPSDERQSQV